MGTEKTPAEFEILRLKPAKRMRNDVMTVTQKRVEYGICGIRMACLRYTASVSFDG